MRKLLFIALCSALMTGALTAASPARTIYVPKTLADRASKVGAGRIGFNFKPTHVVLSWRGEEGTGAKYRLVGPVGPIGKWRRATEWHDMHEIEGIEDQHFSGVLTVPRPLAIEVAPVASKDGVEPGRIEVEYMNTVDGPKEARTIPAVAAAAATTPNVVSRAQWGADESLKKKTGGCKRRFWPLSQLFVHHTAGSNTNSDPAATMRAIYHFHTVSRGWCDLGYNFVIARDGTVFEGRWTRNFKPWETPDAENQNGKAVEGAHTSGWNSGALGVSLMGNYQEATLPTAARTSLVSVLAWIADRHNIDPVARRAFRSPATGASKTLNTIAGHRDAGTTACPGTTVYRSLPSIRKDVATLIGAGRSRSLLSLKASASVIRYGEPAQVSGRLRDETGAGLPARTLTIWAKRGGGKWRVYQEVLTDMTGAFSLDADIDRNFRFAAEYAGEPSVWEGYSKVRRVDMKAIVRFQAANATAGEDGVYRIPFGSSMRFVGQVSPNLAGKRIVIRIFRKKPGGGAVLHKTKRTRVSVDGTYSSGFKPGKAGVGFRAIARLPKSAANAFSKSASIHFVAE